MSDSVSRDELADAMLTFVRSFGLHRGDSTPCGMQITVAEAHALLELSGSPMRQSELCTRLGLTKGTVSRLARILIHRGWVERQPDPHDGRASELVLTVAGVEAATRLASARQQRFAVLLEAIPPTQRTQAVTTLVTLAAAARSTDPRHA